MKILIAETNPNILYGLNIISEQVEDRVIMGEAADRQELFRCVYASCPDVLLISDVFLRLNKGDLLEELQQICPSLIIIIMEVNLPGKEIKLPAHSRNNIEIVQSPEQLFHTLNKIHCTHQSTRGETP